MKTKVYRGHKLPEPEVDMIIENENGRRYILKPCTCDPPEKAWPNMHNGCGPHLWLFDSDGSCEYTGTICYEKRKGWLYNYYIITEDPIVKDTVVKKNTKNITCPLCGSSGEDLVFSFYCSNSGCRNYKI